MRSAGVVFSIFLEPGFDHILDGYDHLLFLAGLIIVTSDWRGLLTVTSAFAVTHSTTLVLSALEIVSLDSAISETLIAASIAFVEVENLVMKGQRHRWNVAAAFGLIHVARFSQVT